jgi:oligopeptide/dipeptide ABC transporter ATP-binding protein
LSEILRIVNLHTYFLTPEGIVKANYGVDLNLRDGETLGLMGESGCGKTVLAYSILRLQQPGEIVAGSIFFNGRELNRLTEKEIGKLRGREIALVPQDPAAFLNPVFTVREQLCETVRVRSGKRGLGNELKGVFKRNGHPEEEIVSLLEEVGIASPRQRIKNYPHELSGGMKQRILIAMALLARPRLIIADEPTTALDVTIQAQILELLKKIKRKTSILLITHDPGVAAEICERVAVMYAGKIIELADPASLFEKPLHPYTQGLFSSLFFFRKTSLPFIEGKIPDLIHFPPGCSFHPRCARKKPVCSVEEPPVVRFKGRWVKCHLY